MQYLIVRAFLVLALAAAVLTCGCAGPSGLKVPACEGREDQLMKDACYMELAVASGDESLCHSISSGNSQRFCRAVVLNDSSACGSLEGGNDTINACYAYSLRNASYCEKVKSKTGKVDCYSISLLLANESSVCSRFEKLEYKDLCYTKMARLANDSVLCGEVQNETSRQSCYKKLNHSA